MVGRTSRVLEPVDGKRRRDAALRGFLCVLLATPAFGQAPEVFAHDHEKPAVGVWAGECSIGEGRPVFAHFVIEQETSGSWVATATVPTLGVIGQRCTEAVVDGGDVRLVLPLIEFSGVLSDDGQRWSGRARMPAADREGTFALSRTVRPADRPGPLAFTGSLTAAGMTIEMTLVLASTAGGDWVGHLDVPVQGLREFPVIIEAEGSRLTVTIPVPAPAVFEVALDETRARLIGKFRQAGMDFDIDFGRDEDYAYRELPRPQHPKPPFPYEVHEIVVPHPEGHRLAGTLTLPSERFGPGPYRCAVLISGSGQQDRDETIFGHKPFLVIADHLTRHGIAVMRYDDRGVGGSSVEDPSSLQTLTSRDLATDTRAVVQHLKGRDDIDAARIGLIGHSEGGLIAPMVCETDPGIAFVVLLAAPGVRGAELLREQMRLMWSFQGADAATVERLAEVFAELETLIVEGAPRPELRDRLLRLRQIQIDGRMAMVAAEEEMVRTGLTLLDNQWMRFFLTYDPAPALARLRVPVLACNGTLDRQVWHEQNLDRIQRILTDAGVDVTVRRYDGLNHLFQPATTGYGTEYATIDTTFDEHVLEDLIAWIREKVAAAPSPQPQPQP